MAFVISDRIKETTITTGTGTVSLNGAVNGFNSFNSGIGDSNTTGYCIIAVDSNGVPTGNWETGIGTYTAAGSTLARTSVIRSSNANALVSFGAGTKQVICCDIAGYLTPLVVADTTNRPIQVADQTALSSTAGNARGKGAVDLQIKRGAATQVASANYSTICGGVNNTASKLRATVCGGSTNTSSGYYAFIGGGQSHIASSNACTVAGGVSNTASSNYAFVGGGRSNVASTNAYAVVAGGKSNTASGSYAFIGSGNLNTASGTQSFVSGGYYNLASATRSAAFGGWAKADKYGQMTHSAGPFGLTRGEAQRSAFVLRISTTTNTQAELFLDGSSARLVLANDTTWAFEILVVARRADVDGENAAWQFSGAVTRNTNAASTSLVQAVNKTILALVTSTWDVDVTADTTNGSLRIRFTGDNSKTIKVVAYVRTCEVTG